MNVKSQPKVMNFIFPHLKVINVTWTRQNTKRKLCRLEKTRNLVIIKNCKILLLEQCMMQAKHKMKWVHSQI